LFRNGVVNVDEVALEVEATAVPPDEFAYQRNVPVALVDALRVTDPGLQVMPSVTEILEALPRVATTANLGLVQAGDVVVKLT